MLTLIDWVVFSGVMRGEVASEGTPRGHRPLPLASAPPHTLTSQPPFAYCCTAPRPAGQRNEYFNFRAISLWLLSAMYQCTIICFFVLYGCSNTIADREAGHPYTMWQMGIVMYSIVIVTVHMQVRGVCGGCAAGLAPKARDPPLGSADRVCACARAGRQLACMGSVLSTGVADACRCASAAARR